MYFFFLWISSKEMLFYRLRAGSTGSVLDSTMHKRASIFHPGLLLPVRQITPASFTGQHFFLWVLTSCSQALPNLLDRQPNFTSKVEFLPSRSSVQIIISHALIRETISAVDAVMLPIHTPSFGAKTLINRAATDGTWGILKATFLPRNRPQPEEHAWLLAPTPAWSSPDSVRGWRPVWRLLSFFYSQVRVRWTASESKNCPGSENFPLFNVSEGFVEKYYFL